MKIISCSLQGQKHKNKNAPCEDSFAILNQNDVFALAVADGAGSAKYVNAREGADTVSKAICRFFTLKFDEFFDVCNEYEMRRIVSAICMNALKEEADKLGLDSVFTMASTLLAVAVKGNKAIACQIGDGLLGMKIGSVLQPVFLPQNGEFASTTFFITEEKAYQMLQVRKFYIDSVTHLFLMSDGISDSVFDDIKGKFEPVMNSLLGYAEADDGSRILSECIEKNVVDQSSVSDDCTMIIASLSEIQSENSLDKKAEPLTDQGTEAETDDGENASKCRKKVHNEDNNDLPLQVMDKPVSKSKKQIIFLKLISIILIALVFLLLGFAVGKNSEKKQNELLSEAENITVTAKNESVSAEEMTSAGITIDTAVETETAKGIENQSITESISATDVQTTTTKIIE